MILAMDTSGGELVVCMLDEALQVSASRVVPGRRHQEVVMEVITELLGGGSAVAGLGAIAVVRGPGSQTGLRVGLSTAEGMAYGARLPLLPVSSLTVAAHRATSAEDVIAVVSAGRSNVYAQRAQGPGELVGERVLCALDEVFERVVAGAHLAVVGEPALMTRADEVGLRLVMGARPSAEALAAAVRQELNAGGLLAYHQLTGDYGES